MTLLNRRRALRLLAAAPLGAALIGCDEGRTFADAGPLGSDAGTADAGLSDAGVCAPTEDDALGPFYEDGSPTRTMIAAPGEPGERMLFEGRLVDAAGCAAPLSNYVIDVWQADAEGNYYAAGTDYRLRGRVVTGADGAFAFETIKPGFYETGGGPRPAHLHVRVYTPDGVDRLVTQLYFEGDAFLGAADGCQPPTCHSYDPARILRLDPARVGGVDGVRATTRLVVPA